MAEPDVPWDSAAGKSHVLKTAESLLLADDQGKLADFAETKVKHVRRRGWEHGEWVDNDETVYQVWKNEDDAWLKTQIQNFEDYLEDSSSRVREEREREIRDGAEKVEHLDERQKQIYLEKSSSTIWTNFFRGEHSRHTPTGWVEEDGWAQSTSSKQTKWHWKQDRHVAGGTTRTFSEEKIGPVLDHLLKILRLTGCEPAFWQLTVHGDHNFFLPKYFGTAQTKCESQEKHFSVRVLEDYTIVQRGRQSDGWNDAMAETLLGAERWDQGGENYFPPVLQKANVPLPESIATRPDEEILQYSFWVLPFRSKKPTIRPRLSVVESRLALQLSASTDNELAFLVELNPENKKFHGLLRSPKFAPSKFGVDDDDVEFLCSDPHPKKAPGLLCDRMMLNTPSGCVALISAQLGPCQGDGLGRKWPIKNLKIHTEFSPFEFFMLPYLIRQHEYKLCCLLVCA